MKSKYVFWRFVSTIAFSSLFFTLIPFIANSQITNTNQANENAPFYTTSDFWGKIALAIVSTSLGTLSGYLLSEKKRRDEAVELSYTTETLSILEFKKDIGKKISIRYGDNYDVSDLYVISCDIENTGSKVIKNENIVFEIHPTNIGVLDLFFEPPLNNNPMGIEEIKIEESKVGEVKKKYLIRDILPGQSVGFRFVTARITQQDKVPNLFLSTKDGSKVQLVPITYKGEKDENFRLRRFVTFLVLFLTLPPIFSTLPFFGDSLAGICRLIIFVFGLPYISTFSTRITKLLILPFSKSDSQLSKYNITIGEGSDISIGDRTVNNQEQD